MKEMEKQNEREAFQMARKLSMYNKIIHSFHLFFILLEDNVIDIITQESRSL
jgi:hypothetical protein